MPTTPEVSHGEDRFPAELAQQLLGYSKAVSEISNSATILEMLDAITAPGLNLNVLCAINFPRKVTDWASLDIGRTVFLNGPTAVAWWQDWIVHVPQRLPIGYALARLSLAPYTWVEGLELMQPTGEDRWGYELAVRHGMQDGFVCPVGGRWVLSFWSPEIISSTLSQAMRIMLFGAASFAVLRLEQIMGKSQGPERVRQFLTPRERAVLRLLSIGTPFKEAAKNLGLGQETIRTHLKKAQLKLGVRNRTHAVAEAIRQHLIP